MIKRTATLTLLGLLPLLSGCALADKLAGVDSNGNPTGVGVAGVVAGVANSMGFGGLSALLTAAAGTYAHLRGRRYRRVAESGIRGTDALLKALDDGKGVTREEAVEIVKAIQYEDGTKLAVEDLLKRVPR